MPYTDEPTRMIRGNRSRSKDDNQSNTNLFDLDDISTEDHTVEIDHHDTFLEEGIDTIKSQPSDNKDDDMTRLVYPRKKPKDEDCESSNFMKDPIAGWVVVIDGPGQGTSLQVGLGMNSIGRDKNQRIKIDFGDDQISRDTHASISYDPKGRLFYLQHGGGRNLTYIDNEGSLVPVLAPMVLPNRSVIQLGDTTLLFIAFCGDKFDWNEHISEV